jgi:hypothetical protein
MAPTEPPPSSVWIHNWLDTKNPVDERTELIRYMKLSTFLLLLDNRLFIPSLRLLQVSDRFEARIPQWCRQASELRFIDIAIDYVRLRR